MKNHKGFLIAFGQCFAAISISIILSSCGTLTGLPAHGGGKRFAVEQELIAASARAAAKNLDISALRGKYVSIYVITVGDQGSGNLAGGRYEWQAAIRGEYSSSPAGITTNSYPTVPSSSTSTTSGIDTVTNGTSVLNAPSRSRTDNKGPGGAASVGAGYAGMGQYRSEAFLNNNDAQFLQAVISEAFMLKGAYVVSPENAQVDVFITVDIFGTHRSRFDVQAYNEERLLAKTAFQVTAFERETRKLIIPPTTSSYEAYYNEKYVLWIGPYEYEKKVQESTPLLVDFKDIVDSSIIKASAVEAALPDGIFNENKEKKVERTRPNEPVKPLIRPETFRPEDVGGEE